MPLLHRQLASQDRGSPIIAVIADFQKIAPFLLIHCRHGEIVHYQNIHVGDRVQHAAQASIRTRHHQFAKQFRDRTVPHGISVAAGLLGQRLCQPRFAHPSWASKQDRVMLSYPLRTREGAHQRTIQPAGIPEIDIFHTGFTGQLGSLQAARHGLVFLPGPMLIHQQTEALVETQRGHLRILHLLAPCLGQSKPAQGMQFIECLLIHHSATSSNSVPV